MSSIRQLQELKSTFDKNTSYRPFIMGKCPEFEKNGLNIRILNIEKCT